MKNKARLLSLAVASCLAALPAVGQEGTGSTTSGSVTVSAQGGSGINDSSKLQQYEVVPEGVFLSGARLSWQGKDDYFLDMKGSHLGLDDQYASLLFGRKGADQLKRLIVSLTVSSLS